MASSRRNLPVIVRELENRTPNPEHDENYVAPVPMPRVEDFSLSSILAYANPEVEEFNKSVKSMAQLYRDDLSDEMQDIIVKQNAITKKIGDVDRMATQTLGATQARVARVQADIYSLQGADLLATEAEKAYDSITSIISMLHEIDVMLPQQERLYPSTSPHKKHYPRIHALMQNNPPRLQSLPISSVTSSHHNSKSRSVSTFSSSKIATSTPQSSYPNSLKHMSSKENSKEVQNSESLNSPSLPIPVKEAIPPAGTENYETSRTLSSSITIKASNAKTLASSVPHGNSGDSDIAIVSSEDELHSNENSSDEEDITSPLQLHRVKTAPTSSVSTNFDLPDNVPIEYPPAMLNLQSVLPHTEATPSNKQNVKDSRSHSFNSMGSAETDASIRSLANHQLDPPKNNSSEYGGRRKSAPFLLRQASGLIAKNSHSNSSFTSSQRSGRPKSFTLTGLFASAWAGVGGILPVEKVIDDHHDEDGDGEEGNESESEDGLSGVFSLPSVRDRRKSTSSARMSLQRIMSIDNNKSILK